MEPGDGRGTKSGLGGGFQASLYHHILKQKSKKSGNLNSNPDVQVVKNIHLSMSKKKIRLCKLDL